MQDFTGALQQQQLLLRQIDAHRCDLRSILDRGRHVWRKRGKSNVLTARTLLLFGSVFVHDQPGRWDVHHLTTQRDTGRHLAQILLTGRADADLMLNHFIGHFRKPQSCSQVPLLPSGFLLALFAQAFWLPH